MNATTCATAASGETAGVTVIRAADLVASPWKNGGGVTREIAAYPTDAGLDTFVWRVSVADVEQPGPFSRFPGIDRTLVLLAGAGMSLVGEGDTAHELDAPLAVARFAGEAALDAHLTDGATRDFNLMLRRGEASGTLEVWRDAGEHAVDADVALIFCAHGTFDVKLGDAAPVRLAAWDTLRIDAADARSLAVAGEGALIAVRIRYA